ncbi:hypothetical protein GCM10022267_73180 [Lentzea roselyniae]|uniref:Uncharacterized protein n=1 Tax=Lentzea roselyniae TaxID=531940 RepID=A0ABP7C0J8_9PSEU
MQPGQGVPFPLRAPQVVDQLAVGGHAQPRLDLFYRRIVAVTDLLRIAGQHGQQGLMHAVLGLGGR